jgi:hypothetical protein
LQASEEALLESELTSTFRRCHQPQGHELELVDAVGEAEDEGLEDS